MKRKVLLVLLLLLFPTAGIVFGSHHAIASGTASSGRRSAMHLNTPHAALGSMEYVDQIIHTAIEKGYQSALHQLMEDVRLSGKEMDTNPADNNSRLYRLASYLVYKIGHVDEKTHYFRNELNRAPGSLSEMLRANAKLDPSKRWRLLSVQNSLYHLQGKDGIYNLKFISSDGFCEAVYNKRGELLTEKNDPINMGTFNFAAGIPEPGAHNTFDVQPYLKWGNTPDSPQKGKDHIDAAIKLVIQAYNEHSTGVTAYRNSIMNRHSIKSA